jgi:hypothetical protein
LVEVNAMAVAAAVNKRRFMVVPQGRVCECVQHAAPQRFAWHGCDESTTARMSRQ